VALNSRRFFHAPPVLPGFKLNSKAKLPRSEQLQETSVQCGTELLTQKTYMCKEQTLTARHFKEQTAYSGHIFSSLGGVLSAYY